MRDPEFHNSSRLSRKVALILTFAALWLFVAVVGEAPAQKSVSKNSAKKEAGAEFSWEMPGRVSIYDLQFGPAVLKNNEWNFLDNLRTFDAGKFAGRLTLMVRFSYKGSKSDVPLKFIIRLPGSRQYEETVRLPQQEGQYTYKFTIQNPEDFVGSGSVYVYYGFSMVDVLDFTIIPAT
jgi:hypothetical protein